MRRVTLKVESSVFLKCEEREGIYLDTVTFKCDTIELHPEQLVEVLEVHCAKNGDIAMEFGQLLFSI